MLRSVLMSHASRSCMRRLGVVATLSLALAGGCAKDPVQHSDSPAPFTSEISPALDAQSAPPLDAAPAMDPIQRVSLRGETPVLVPGTELSVFISASSHKIRAPLAMVSILVSLGDQKAEVSWRIESNQIEDVWLPLQGRRYDSETDEYVEEEIPGWLVRLESIDETSANASPRAITVTFRPAN